MKNPAARKDFGLTTVNMRAMEMILARPGPDLGKARPARSCAAHASPSLMRHARAQLAILVAGPDWLTSVLAGMLGTDVFHVLAWQMPPTVLLISGPATLAGAFQLRAAVDAGLQPLSSLLLFFVALVQVRLGSGCCAACWPDARHRTIKGRGAHDAVPAPEPRGEEARA